MSGIREDKTIVTIGTFDGVHRGHQRILASLNEIAAKEHFSRLAYAFSFPPRLAVRGEERGLILPEDVKERLLKHHVDRVERVMFADVSGIYPEEFVNEILLAGLHARAIVVGENFRFGHGRAGDVPLLRDLCLRKSVSVISVPPVIVHFKFSITIVRCVSTVV